MKTSQKGIDLIKSFEKLELKAYYCPAGILTIGYGHTGKDVEKDMVIKVAEAENLLKKDLLMPEISVNNLNNKLSLYQKLSQNQFDALVSFVFNVGSGNFDNSTLKKLILKDPNSPLISTAFTMWVKANGKTLGGLVRRRKAESELYFQHIQLGPAGFATLQRTS
jgi:lysozyme